MSDFFIKAHTSFVGQTGYNAHARDFFTALSLKTPLKIKNFTVGKSWKGLTFNNITGKYDDPHKSEFYLTDYQRSLMCEQTLYCSQTEKNRYGAGICDYEINEGNEYLKKYKSEDIIDIILSETNHHYFHCLDKYKGIKIAYNVWESTRYEDSFFELLKKFDQFWCPSEWQRQCIIKQGYPADKVFVVPEAVDGNIFTPAYFNYNLEMYKDNRFKFLLIGRWEYRKATKEIIETFLKTFKKDEPVDLILVVDNADYAVDGMKTTEERLNHFGLKDDRLKIVHFLERKDYIDYLRNGHVYLSCSRSEGWNLPLIEAMACGNPAIYSNCSGQLEFAEGKGHPVRITGEKPIPNSVGNYYEPDFDDLSVVMRDVYVNYWKYKAKALKDSKIIRKQFSWENAANKAYEILDATHKGQTLENFATKFIDSQIDLEPEFADIINENFEELTYDNVEEQRFWNNKDEWVNNEKWSNIFGGSQKIWDNIIYPKIKDYLKGEILEIAPGYGRMTEYLLKHTNNLSVVELNENCIVKCKERFGDKIKNYVVNDGKSLRNFATDSLDFVFSWDSFVHMDKYVIQEYLYEIYRTLKRGGVGYIHHSFFSGNIKSRENIAGRSNMNPDLFKELLEHCKLTLISQEQIEGNVIDTISIFKK